MRFLVVAFASAMAWASPAAGSAPSIPQHTPFPIVPDPTLTPGVAGLGITKKDVCTKGWAKTHRHVTESERKKVFEEYGLSAYIHHHHFELDHLISLELGGLNVAMNLWPESYQTPIWNAHVKDKLEDHLHWLVCHDHLTLLNAQEAISSNWIKAYKKYMPVEDWPKGSKHSSK